MLYQNSETLNRELFENPTSEYRGTPFWALNCKLNNELLTEQIDFLKEMGFGGFHMHVRTGMATPYLSDEYMGYIKHCVEKARSEQMLAYLYDEDRWPSGAAGGLVTKNEQYRARHLLFTATPYEEKAADDVEAASATFGFRTDIGTPIAFYDVELDEGGFLKSYRQIGEADTAAHAKWYAYLEIERPSPWFNNQTYVNTLDKKAIDEFIRITYEAYKNTVSEDFGGIIPSMFTDEPQFSHKSLPTHSLEPQDVVLPWTDDVPDTYREAYHSEILDTLPELIWELPDGALSVHRYRYHDHIAERFATAFADSCGDWCKANNLMLTGHMMEEPSLFSQTAALGEAMRSYRSFGLPGIDMLCDSHEYTTAKQAQSAAHQFGYEGVLSELYGVTGWDFDFRGHKSQGDWQAALGVTVRVPHLSWVSMAGEAKRDYPASINYQSPWYKEYPLIENHFARVNTALTRGKPVVKIGVVHPIESYWLHWGPKDKTELIRNELDRKFNNITDWLLFSQLDFDFISESLLPLQYKGKGKAFRVGEMAYDTVIVPGCETLRLSTVERLEEFAAAGGRLVFLGEAPRYIDGLPNDRAGKLYQNAAVIPYERVALTDLLECARVLDIRTADGSRANDLLYNLRQDKDCNWLFITKGRGYDNPDIVRGTDYIITVKGEFAAELYDTMTGSISALPARYVQGNTVIDRRFHEQDSLLLKLTAGKQEIATSVPCATTAANPYTLFDKVKVTLDEPNVLMLDMARFAFDDGDEQPLDEVLRIDNKLRKTLGLPSRMEAVSQPWTLEDETPVHTLHLYFDIVSEIEVATPVLAMECAGAATIELNGVAVPSTVIGYYVDRAIDRVALPPLKAGNNVLALHIPFGQRTDVEWCYILGDFGVRTAGCKSVITPPVRELAFGDITRQGLPFYGGNVTYQMEVEVKEGRLGIKAANYRGGLIKVLLDGEQQGTIVFSPYTLEMENVPNGTHLLELTCYGNRANTFGAVHGADLKVWWLGPNMWRTTGDEWSYEYILKRTGILKSPEIWG